MEGVMQFRWSRDHHQPWAYLIDHMIERPEGGENEEEKKNVLTVSVVCCRFFLWPKDMIYMEQNKSLCGPVLAFKDDFRSRRLSNCFYNSGTHLNVYNKLIRWDRMRRENILQNHFLPCCPICLSMQYHRHFSVFYASLIYFLFLTNSRMFIIYLSL